MKIHFGNERWHQAASLALRYEVFVLEQGISLQAEFDVLDTAARCYFTAYEKQLALGTVRYQRLDSETIQPDRFCVKKEYRGQGIGTALLQQLESKAFSEGYRYSVLSAEKTAVYFYEARGYAVCSDEYIEDGIVCVKMQKKLECMRQK
ncbi:GNAT family N-acetyltransferase [Erwinia sp. CPCC 100877]|nr:GNAT family N-acetyltransferase [Erwinia sp. CPCC 100877]